MNEVLKTISQRYSCRDYSNVLPPDDVLNAIAEAAIQSPSAMNNQPWHIIVVKNKELLNDLDREALYILSKMEDQSAYQRMMSRGGRLFYNAPCMYLILKKPGSDLDCGIVSQTIALAATSLGLSNVICGLAGLSFSGSRCEEFKIRLSMPKDYEFGMSVLVGMPKAKGTPHIPDKSKISIIE